MTAAVVGALAGFLGVILGRFWDRASEVARWRRDQRIRTYEDIGASYYELREAIRAVALLEPDTSESDLASSHVLDIGTHFNSGVVAVWLHGSVSVATSVRELDREIIKLFLLARTDRFTYEGWRTMRASADDALERFVEAVRLELSLPPVPVAIRIADLSEPRA